MNSNSKMRRPRLVVAALAVMLGCMTVGTAQTTTIPCAVTSVGKYADKDAKLTVRCDTNGDPVFEKGWLFSLLWPTPSSEPAPAPVEEQRPRGEATDTSGLTGKPVFDPATDLTYQGGFLLPAVAGSAFSGYGLAYRADTNTLYVTGNAAEGTGMQVQEISIPAAVNTSDIGAMNTATLIQTAADPTEGHINELTSDTAEYRNWSLLVHGGRLIGAGYEFYDTEPFNTVTFYSRSLNLAAADFLGWDAIWNNQKTGLYAGPMAAIPSYAQAALGGPVLATGPRASILERLSSGPSAFTFDPADITDRTASTLTGYPLMYFTTGQQEIVAGHDDFPGSGGGSGDPTDIWNRTTGIGGVVIPTGYRSVLYWMKHGYGDYCYGPRTLILAEHGEVVVPGQSYKCYDEQNGSTGEHGWPYRMQVLAYDLNHLAEVKAGTRQPYDFQGLHTSRWTFTFPVAWPSDYMPTVGGVAYDPTNKAIYVAQIAGQNPTGNQRAIIHKWTHP